MSSLSRRQVLAGATSLAIGAGITARPSAARAAIAPPPNFSYSYGSDMYLVPPAGGAPQIIGETHHGFYWSPDGSRLANVVEGIRIESWRPDGTARFPVSFPGQNEDLYPTFTPDGRWLVYARNLPNDREQRRLWWSSSDGLWDRGDVFPSFAGSLGFPAISRDGLLAFTVGKGIFPSEDLYTAWLTAFGWSQPQLIVENATMPSFSPDGTKLAYISRTADVGLLQDVWIADIDGSDGFKVSPDDRVENFLYPIWSPDGTHLYAATFAGPFARMPARSGGAVEDLTVSGWLPAFRSTKRNAVTRVWGNLALDTALAVSQSMWATAGQPSDQREKANAVVLSRSDVFYDALAGSALAANKRAPLLITPPTGLYGPTETEIRRVIGPGGLVYLLGGEAALPKHIEDRLKTLGYQVKRLWGATMFETATAIADEITTDPSAVFVATGVEYYDALAAGAAAGSGAWGKAVVILTDGTRMPASSAAYLDKLDPTQVNMITAGGPGNTALIRDAYQGGKLPSWPGRIDYYNLTGATAVETALLVAQATFASPQQVALATTDGWYDALTGGAMIGARGGPLLLTPPSALHPNAATYLNESSASIHTAYLLGGPAALPQRLAAPIGDNIGVPGMWDYNDTTTKAQAEAKTQAQSQVQDSHAIRPARDKQRAQR